MNPFDLRGPPFLFFYLVAAGATLFIVWFRIRKQEAIVSVPKLNLTDPYEIAYLRGGAHEALRIAAVSMVDRGLLVASEELLMVKKSASSENVRRPIERALMKKFAVIAPALGMFQDEGLSEACHGYKASLGKIGLVANAKVRAERLPWFFFGLAVILGLSGIKILAAISRGHYNLFFLIVLTGIAVYLLFKTIDRERTLLGDRVLADLKSLFQGLQARGSSLKAGGETNEAALLAALYGISALPSESFPYIDKLFPKASANESSSSSSSCGASSCGSSGGGGCGGGGCGGCGGD